jgi:hypothetical protein
MTPPVVRISVLSARRKDELLRLVHPGEAS